MTALSARLRGNGVLLGVRLLPAGVIRIGVMLLVDVDVFEAGDVAFDDGVIVVFESFHRNVAVVVVALFLFEVVAFIDCAFLFEDAFDFAFVVFIVCGFVFDGRRVLFTLAGCGGRGADTSTIGVAAVLRLASAGVNHFCHVVSAIF